MIRIREFVKKNISIFSMYGINLLLLLIFWGGMIRASFNADTLAHMYSEDADVMINVLDGRYVIALCDKLLLLFGVRVTDNMALTTAVSIVLFAVVMTVIQKIFYEYRPQGKLEGIAFDGALSLVFLNVLFSEDFMFTECCVYFAIAYFFAALGALFFSKKRVVAAAVCFLIGASTYQYSVIFAAITMAFLCMLRQNAELTVKNAITEILSVILPVSMGLVNLMLIKLVAALGIADDFRKDMNVGGLADKIKAAVSALIKLNKSGYELMHAFWLPAIVSIIAVVIVSYLLLKEKKIAKLIYALMVYVGSVILLFIIPVMNSRFNFPPRMSFCFFLVQGLLIASVYALVSDSSGEKTKALLRLLSMVCLGYLFINYLYIGFIIDNRYATNALDREIAKQIDYELTKYEKETGNEVIKLATVNDTNAPVHYNEITYAVEQINERTIVYSPCSLIRYSTGRVLSRTEMDETVYKDNFEGRNWDCFDPDEQLVIIGDTAYWCIF